ncbi:hypothetical protein D3C87_1097760 [compost metagenome]
MKKFLVPVLIVAAWGIFKVGSVKYHHYVSVGESKEIETILNSYAAAENAFRGEYNKYTNDPTRLGYSVKPGKLKVYFSAEGLPPRFYSVLPPTSLPEFTDASYRILLASENTRTNRIDFWTITQEKKPQQLKEFLMLDPLKVD